MTITPITGNNDAPDREYTIGEVARELGVTPRTLRHWDTIGLLSPMWRSADNYRLYTDSDIRTGYRIVVLRAVGVPLAEISRILADPAAQMSVLREHRQRLDRDAVNLRARLRAVDQLIEDIDMTEKVHSTTRDENTDSDPWKNTWETLKEEAQQRWGTTEAWAESEHNHHSGAGSSWESMMAAHSEFVSLLAAAYTAGVTAGSNEADTLVRQHREIISRSYRCTPSRQVVLVRMYVDDSRFAAFYHGHAPYLRELVEDLAAREGVNLDAVSWD